MPTVTSLNMSQTTVFVYKVCKYCQNDVLLGNPGHCTSGCGRGRRIFEGKNCRNDFCDWLFHERNEGATVIAHDSKGYDGQFLVQYLVKEGIAPIVITRGTEFMKVRFLFFGPLFCMLLCIDFNTIRNYSILFFQIVCQKIRVIDSLNFFPMGLAELPKAFNLTELKKGFFPHKFNRPENQDYIGSIPEPWNFDPDQMRVEKREEFYQWYNAQKVLGKDYNFKEELAAYCQSDVDILMRSCLKFEKEVEDLTEIRCGYNDCIILHVPFSQKFLERGHDRTHTTLWLQRERKSEHYWLEVAEVAQ